MPLIVVGSSTENFEGLDANDLGPREAGAEEPSADAVPSEAADCDDDRVLGHFVNPEHQFNTLQAALSGQHDSERLVEYNILDMIANS